MTSSALAVNTAEGADDVGSIAKKIREIFS